MYLFPSVFSTETDSSFYITRVCRQKLDAEWVYMRMSSFSWPTTMTLADPPTAAWRRFVWSIFLQLFEARDGGRKGQTSTQQNEERKDESTKKNKPMTMGDELTDWQRREENEWVKTNGRSDDDEWRTNWQSTTGEERVSEDKRAWGGLTAGVRVSEEESTCRRNNWRPDCTPTTTEWRQTDRSTTN